MKKSSNVLYPPIEPYCSNWLDVGDGLRLYYEECGNRGEKPVVVLHGGPGGAGSPSMHQFFNPEKYRQEYSHD